MVCEGLPHEQEGWRPGGDACKVGAKWLAAEWRAGGDACKVGARWLAAEWRPGGDACSVEDIRTTAQRGGGWFPLPTRREIEQYEAEWAAIDRHGRRGEGVAEMQAWRREQAEEQQENEGVQEHGTRQGWDQRGEGWQQQEGGASPLGG